MENKINKFVYWIPRILSVLFLLFLTVFSLDVFRPGLSAGQIALGLFMHNIPVFILLAVLIISWKREIVGGIVFILAGLLYCGLCIVRYQTEWYMLSWSLTIAGPAFLIGILFLVGWRQKRKLKQITEISPLENTKNKYQKSYSQSGEDIILSFIFKALKIDKPTYLDVGAFDPYEDSNTAIFYEKGSRGINIEPVLERYKKFVSERPDDINLNVVISDREGSAAFYILSSEKMSTLLKLKADDLTNSHKMKTKEIRNVKLTTINKIIEDYCGGIFPDLFSLDVEGMDLAVLHSIDWKKYAPLVMCVETASYSTNGNEIKDTELISYLESVGYMIYADTRINTIFVKRDRYINHL